MVGVRPRFLFRTILFLTAATAWSQSFDQLAQGLAEKIDAALKPREPVFLSFRNISSMSPSDLAAAQTAIERALRVRGVESAAPARGIEVVVTLSENLLDSVWVAELRRGDARTVVLEEGPKPPAAVSAASMVIEKKLLFEQDQRILDLAPMGGALLVLDAEAVSIYENAGGWQRKLSVRLPVSRPWPRDLRGRILVQGDVYQAYLPGLTCNGNAAGGLSVTCRDESLWPVGAGPGMLGLAQFTPTRNFFDGRVIAPNGSQKSLHAFFSAASFESRGNVVWALAGTDGRTHLYNTALENAGEWGVWGSGIARIESECGGRSQVLATAAGDGTVQDSVQAYEIVDGAPRHAGDAVAFSGPVTALWPAGERGVVFAISRDLRSGRYAAFRLAITCTH